MRTFMLGLLALSATTFALLSSGAPVAADPTDKEKSEMAAKVYTLLKDKCYSCHGEAGKKVMGKKGTLNYILDYDKLVSEKLIDTASPEKSPLYEEISEGNMPRELDKDGKPKAKKKLAQAEIDLVLNWINAGAPKWELGAGGADEKSAWAELNIEGPEPRSASLMCEGPKNTIVLFGGRNADKDLNDTWVFSSGTWKRAIPKKNPDAASSDTGVIAFDRKRGLSVLWDQRVGTWSWDGAEWKEETVKPGPGGRMGASLAYSESLGKLVLFGGMHVVTDEMSDTWTYDGKTWNKLEIAEAPERRQCAAMAWSPVNKALLLYGGMKGSNRFRDTWTFDGKAWKKHEPATSPAQQGTLASNPAGVLLVNSGRGTVDTWQWDGKDWSHIVDGPNARDGFALASDTKNGRVILFGGKSDGRNCGDTWTFAPAK